jgi:hypothetical protein
MGLQPVPEWNLNPNCLPICIALSNFPQSPRKKPNLNQAGPFQIRISC